MKSYLIACNLGDNCIKAYQIETPDDYLLASDNLQFLKEQIIEQHKPKRMQICCLSSGNVIWREMSAFAPFDGFWTAQDLKIVAVSRIE